jgi:hypothetical protein
MLASSTSVLLMLSLLSATRFWPSLRVSGFPALSRLAHALALGDLRLAVAIDGVDVDVGDRHVAEERQQVLLQPPLVVELGVGS